jgi:hypothetical protein
MAKRVRALTALTDDNGAANALLSLSVKKNHSDDVDASAASPRKRHKATTDPQVSSKPNSTTADSSSDKGHKSIPKKDLEECEVRRETFSAAATSTHGDGVNVSDDEDFVGAAARRNKGFLQPPPPLMTSSMFKIMSIGRPLGAPPKLPQVAPGKVFKLVKVPSSSRS